MSILSPEAGTLPVTWLSRPASVVTVSSACSPKCTPNNSSTASIAMLPRITNPPSGSRTTSGASGFPLLPHVVREPDGGLVMRGSMANHVGRQRLSVVATLPDNFFNQVFHSGDTRHRTMFINNHGQRMPLLPHFSQQVRSNLGFRHEQNRFHQLPYFSFQQILIRNL